MTALRFLALAALILTALPIDAAEPRWLAGAAKVDITPDYPVRLSGYGARLLGLVRSQPTLRPAHDQR